MHVRDIEHQFNLLIKKQNTMCTRRLKEQSKKNNIEASILKFHKMIAQGPSVTRSKGFFQFNKKFLSQVKVHMNRKLFLFS